MLRSGTRRCIQYWRVFYSARAARRRRNVRSARYRARRAPSERPTVPRPGAWAMSHVLHRRRASQKINRIQSPLKRRPPVRRLPGLRYDAAMRQSPLIPAFPPSIRRRWPIPGRSHLKTPWSAAPVAGGRIRQRRSDMKLHELSPTIRGQPSPASGLAAVPARARVRPVAGVSRARNRARAWRSKGMKAARCRSTSVCRSAASTCAPAKKYAVVNLGLIQKLIDAKKLDAKGDDHRGRAGRKRSGAAQAGRCAGPGQGRVFREGEAGRYRCIQVRD